VPILKDLRYRLQQRKDTILKSDHTSLKANVHYFFTFISENPLLKSIVEELSAHDKAVSELKESQPERQTRTGHRVSMPIFDSEEHLASFCLSWLKELIGSERSELDLLQYISLKHHLDEQIDDFNEKILMPFYQYIDERVDDFNSTLYLLQKYKYASEWFERERLYGLYKSDEAKGEANLDRDLRRFLFLQGIDYPFSSPLSASGRADIVAELDTDHPLVLEIKIFDLEKSYNKNYIRKGFWQAYNYANDYNEPAGYLFIFKTCERAPIFNLKETELPHRIIVGDKTIFILQTDIFVYDKSVSERKKIDPYVIDEDYLISTE